MSDGPSSRHLILVVDDEPVVLSLLCEILTGHGYVVVGAASGEQALEAYRVCGPFDLMLADVVMPRVSGPELADRLWQMDRTLRVLFIAGLPDSPAIRTAIVDRGLPLLPSLSYPAISSRESRKSSAAPPRDSARAVEFSSVEAASASTGKHQMRLIYSACSSHSTGPGDANTFCTHFSNVGGTNGLRRNASGRFSARIVPVIAPDMTMTLISGLINRELYIELYDRYR